MHVQKNSTLEHQFLKLRRLVFDLSITANATPASKIHSSDLPSVCVLRTEGKVSEADAIEDLSGSFTTADDENAGDSVFGVLLHNLEEIEKVYSISVSEQTSLSSSLSVSALGTRGLTSGGNIAFNISGTGLRLDTESPVIRVTVEYLEK